MPAMIRDGDSAFYQLKAKSYIELCKYNAEAKRFPKSSLKYETNTYTCAHIPLHNLILTFSYLSPPLPFSISVLPEAKIRSPDIPVL